MSKVQNQKEIKSLIKSARMNLKLSRVFFALFLIVKFTLVVSYCSKDHKNENRLQVNDWNPMHLTSDENKKFSWQK